MGDIPWPPTGWILGGRRTGCSRIKALLLPEDAALPCWPYRKTSQLRSVGKMKREISCKDYLYKLHVFGDLLMEVAVTTIGWVGRSWNDGSFFVHCKKTIFGSHHSVGSIPQSTNNSSALNGFGYQKKWLPVEIIIVYCLVTGSPLVFTKYKVLLSSIFSKVVICN